MRAYSALQGILTNSATDNSHCVNQFCINTNLNCIPSVVIVLRHVNMNNLLHLSLPIEPDFRQLIMQLATLLLQLFLSLKCTCCFCLNPI